MPGAVPPLLCTLWRGAELNRENFVVLFKLFNMILRLGIATGHGLGG
jgi:hypothetical protein